MLSPPSWKKSSCAPTLSIRSTLATASQTRRSFSVAGATGAPAPTAGSGSAFRSVLPFAVSGNSVSTTRWAGTMYSTMLAVAHSLTSSALRSWWPPDGMTYPIR